MPQGIAASLCGATRVIAIFGDPIAQVQSPAGVSAALNEAGRNGVVIPVHVGAADLDAFMRGGAVARNFDGLIATVPHKFAAYAPAPAPASVRTCRARSM